VSDDNFLSRWSKRKLASKAGPDPPTAEVIPQPASKAGPDRPTADAVPAEAGTAPLPPVESLTPESDFSPFMKGDVDPGLRRAALKTLFKDPRFNVMDMMDTYVDDYSKPDPLPAGWLEKMASAARLGDYRPPVPDEEPADVPPEAEKIEEEQAVAEPPFDTSGPSPDPPESKQS
jgi:hypothetical protein